MYRCVLHPLSYKTLEILKLAYYKHNHIFIPLSNTNDSYHRKQNLTIVL